MNKMLITIGCFIIALILAITLLWPKYQNLQAVKLHIGGKEAELQSKEEYFNQLKEISKQLEEYGESFSKISSAIPGDPSLPDLFNFFQLAASQTGLILIDVRLGGITSSEKQEDVFKEINVALDMTGSYQAFKDFLSVLEKSSRMIKVENLSVSSPAEDLDESASFQIDIKTYSY